MLGGGGKPLWLETVATLFPPVQFAAPPHVLEGGKRAKVPRPPKIVFPEDRFWRAFYRANAAERYRPACLDERLSRDFSLDGMQPSERYYCKVLSCDAVC